MDFLKGRGRTPIVPSNIDEAALDEWAWVQVTLGYHRETTTTTGPRAGDRRASGERPFP